MTKHFATTLLLLTLSLPALANDMNVANKLFDWAEQNYPGFFSPPGTQSFGIDMFIVRYYADKNIYLGVAQDDVYVYGDIFGGLLNVGKISDFISIDTASTDATRFTVDDANGTITDSTTGLMWQNSMLSHNERDGAISFCTNLSHAGYTDWRLSNMAESGEFHLQTNTAGITPTQLFSGCTAEVVSDGYVRTKKGAETYGGNPGNQINFMGGANVRCVRTR